MIDKKKCVRKRAEIGATFYSSISRGLREFPDFGNCNLYSIDLSGNNITSFFGLGMHPALKILRMDNCPIISLRGGCFQPSLDIFSVKNSPISKFKHFNSMIIAVFGKKISTINGIKTNNKMIENSLLITPYVLKKMQENYLIRNLNPIEIWIPGTKEAIQIDMKENEIFQKEQTIIQNQTEIEQLKKEIEEKKTRFSKIHRVSGKISTSKLCTIAHNIKQRRNTSFLQPEDILLVQNEFSFENKDNEISSINPKQEDTNQEHFGNISFIDSFDDEELGNDQQIMLFEDDSFKRIEESSKQVEEETKPITIETKVTEEEEELNVIETKVTEEEELNVIETKVTKEEPNVIETKVTEEEEEPNVIETKVAKEEPTIVETKVAKEEPTIVETKVSKEEPISGEAKATKEEMKPITVDTKAANLEE